ncbi:hypothetical protein MRX96_047433 [Rhipicephalus microplus]
MLPFETPSIFDQLPRFVFKMPRVVPDQKAKFESDELFRRLSRECEIRYTGYRDRPLEERQVRFQNACREGHTEVAFVATGTNLQLVFSPCHNGYVDCCDFDKERGKMAMELCVNCSSFEHHGSERIRIVTRGRIKLHERPWSVVARYKLCAAEGVGLNAASGARTRPNGQLSKQLFGAAQKSDAACLGRLKREAGCSVDSGDPCRGERLDASKRPQGPQSSNCSNRASVREQPLNRTRSLSRSWTAGARTNTVIRCPMTAIAWRERAPSPSKCACVHRPALVAAKPSVSV